MRSLVVLVALIFGGCANNHTPDFYIGWARDYENGLHVRKEFDAFAFDVQYQPDWYLNAVETGSLSFTKRSDSDNIQQYILDIAVEGSGANILNYGVSSQQEVQQRQYYFSYQFEQDIKLEENGKLYPCILFHFEGGNDMASHRRFILGFEDSGTDEANLVINSILFSSLPIRIKISKRIPDL